MTDLEIKGETGEILSKEQEAQYKEAFDLYDEDGDGKINSEEYGEWLKQIGLTFTKDEVDEMIRDENPEMKINFNQFLKLVPSSKKQGSVEQEIMQAFKEYDKDLKKVISLSDCKRLLSEQGKLTKEEINELLDEAKLMINDNEINYEEFVRMLIAKSN